MRVYILLYLISCKWMIAQGAQKQRNELDYHRFCSYAASQVLGMQTQGEYLYIVQPNKISVFEYHGNSDFPQLSEELIHNQPILAYTINSHYICTHSLSQLEVRDRKHWGHLLYSQQLPALPYPAQLVLNNHFLFLSTLSQSSLVFEKIDLRAKRIVETIDMGIAKPSFHQPIFLEKVGLLNDFYIWKRNERRVELGMLYQNGADSKRKYQINFIDLQNSTIQHLFHHRLNCQKYPNQSSQYVLIIANNHTLKQLTLTICQILPKHRHHQHTHGDFENVLNQFAFLGKYNPLFTENSTGKQRQVDKQGQLTQSSLTAQIQLDNLRDYESSFIENNVLWILSKTRICRIELVSEDSVEHIIQTKSISEKIIKNIQYEGKEAKKKGLCLYRGKLVFQEQTLSFLLGYPKQASQQIAEEIEQYEVNDEVLEKNYANDSKNELQISNLCNDIIELALKQRQEHIQKDQEDEEQDEEVDACDGEEGIDDELIQPLHKSVNTEQKRQMISFHSQTVIHSAYSCEVGMQTDPEIHVPAIGVEQVQDLLAKYSSSLNVNCVKIKQSQFQKDKFDREIFNIVDTMARSQIQPFLEQKFASIIDAKIKELSAGIMNTLHQQIENLNENMRKIEIKEGNLRGRRIFDFSNQVDHFKETIGGVVQALKINQLNRFAFNDLILDEARIIKQKVVEIEASVSQLTNKNQNSQREIQDQVVEILGLIKNLGSKEEKDESDSEMEESGDESQEEEEQVSESSEQKSNQDFQEEEENNVQSIPNYNYSQFAYAPRGYPQRKGNPPPFPQGQGYPREMQGYPHPEFYSPPIPQMPPYFYPYMHQPHLYQPQPPPYFPTSMPPRSKETIKTASKARPEKKQKKTTL